MLPARAHPRSHRTPARVAHLDPGVAPDLRVVNRNAQILLKQVNDLLDVAKLEAGKMQVDYAETDLAYLVRLAARHFEPAADERRITLQVEAEGVLPAQVDAEKLQRVLFNLLSNAIKFTPAGGRIRCSLRHDSAHQLGIIEVADSGRGIPAEHREAIFERFRQLEGGAARRFGGTGLGLAIARDFATLHGGTLVAGEAPEGGALFTAVIPLVAPKGAKVAIMVEAQGGKVGVVSTVGKGSTFHAILPMHARGTATIAPPSFYAGPRDDAPLVLVIEDHPRDQAFLVGTLTTAGYAVETASTRQRALQRCGEKRLDAITLDLLLPNGSGLDVVTRGHRRHHGRAATGRAGLAPRTRRTPSSEAFALALASPTPRNRSSNRHPRRQGDRGAQDWTRSVGLTVAQPAIVKEPGSGHGECSVSGR